MYAGHTARIAIFRAKNQSKSIIKCQRERGRQHCVTADIFPSNHQLGRVRKREGRERERGIKSIIDSSKLIRATVSMNQI